MRLFLDSSAGSQSVTVFANAVHFIERPPLQAADALAHTECAGRIIDFFHQLVGNHEAGTD